MSSMIPPVIRPNSDGERRVCERRNTDMKHALVLVALLVAAPVKAQEPTPLDWPPQHRALAGHISDALVGINLTMDTIHSLHQPDKWKAFRCQAMRYGTILGSTVTTKRLVHRLRPDASDDEVRAAARIACAKRPKCGAVGIVYDPVAIRTHQGHIASRFDQRIFGELA